MTANSEEKNTMRKRTCRKCGKDQSFLYFYKKAQRWSSWCKECDKFAKKTRYLKISNQKRLMHLTLEERDSEIKLGRIAGVREKTLWDTIPVIEFFSETTDLENSYNEVRIRDLARLIFKIYKKHHTKMLLKREQENQRLREQLGIELS